MPPARRRSAVQKQPSAKQPKTPDKVETKAKTKAQANPKTTRKPTVQLDLRQSRRGDSSTSELSDGDSSITTEDTRGGVSTAADTRIKGDEFIKTVPSVNPPIQVSIPAPQHLLVSEN